VLLRSGQRSSNLSKHGQYFYGETDFGFRGLTVPGKTTRYVGMGFDHQAEAQAAMRWAAVATCEREQLKWVRVALAWQDLARGDEIALTTKEAWAH
jgi:hypothetical protein